MPSPSDAPSVPFVRRVGRPSKAESFAGRVEEILARSPDIPTRDLLAHAQRSGYEGGKSAFYALVARSRSAEEAPAGGASAGERSHHDVGESAVTLAGGERVRVRFFVSRMAYSGWLAVSLLDDLGVESIARALVEHLAAMGGVPLVLRFEHPTAVAEAWNWRGEVSTWKLAFAYLAAELGVGLEVRRPRALGRRLKDQFFRGRVLRDRPDIVEQLSAWCHANNVGTPSDARPGAAATPLTLLAHERRRMRSLPFPPADMVIREPMFVGAGGSVVHGSRVYSMPAAAAGRLGVVLLGRDRVRLVAGPFEAEHDREANFRK